LRINRIPLSATKGSAKLALSIVLLYVLVLFPAMRFAFPSALWVLDSGALLFYFVSLSILLLRKSITWAELGFCPDQSHLILAAILAGSIAFFPFALDSMIRLTGINQYEFFADAINQRAPGIAGIPLSSLVEKVLLGPLLTQVFLIGFVTHIMLKQKNSIIAIYGAGLLFMLVGFDLSIGLFILGCLSAFLFKSTGTLFASIGLHIGGAIAGLMVANAYPRLYTVVGLLY
jgi:hypothetical protein